MEKIIIEGGKKLEGELKVQGSKNSALPILAATVSVGGVSVIHNCPHLTDVDAAIKILQYLGCSVSWDGDTVTVDATTIHRYDIPAELMKEMRSSIAFLGPLLARLGKADLLTSPGGCDIGSRPIDFHIAAMTQFGAEIVEESGRLICNSTKQLTGSKITLTKPSVGATENIMIVAATAKGTTTIINAAREPEISDLANYLVRCGAKIRGAGEGTITIDGVDALHSAEHKVIPDRIVASTYMTAAAVTHGSVVLRNIIPAHISPMIYAFEEAGCKIRANGTSLWLKTPPHLNRIKMVRTAPYPGFPTDAQANIMVMACVASGTSMIVENIFECRFKHVGELKKLGAHISIEDKVAVVEGVPQLFGTNVKAPDLRGGAALVVAGLAAEGITKVGGVHLIDRGCESLEENLGILGARIKREECNESN